MTAFHRAMILAAGRGERLRPLTDTTPKPLIRVAGKSLIEYHLEKLARAGIRDIVINTAWLAEKIHRQLGDGSVYGVNIHYSDEGTALETAGGIIKALPLLGEQPFLVVNGDIWTDLDFATLPPLHPEHLAHLVLVDNPAHNTRGDFALEDGLLKTRGDNCYTFSGIGIYRPAFFSGQQQGILALGPLLRQKAEQQLISAQLYNGQWTDVGSVERLQQLEQQISL